MNDLNEYTSVGSAAQSYDTDGNLLDGRDNTYTYDSRATHVDRRPAGTTTYTYDALGTGVQHDRRTGHAVPERPGGPTGTVVGEFDGKRSDSPTTPRPWAHEAG